VKKYNEDEVIDISAWANAGSNHLSIETSGMDYLCSKALVRDVQRMAKKYPGIRFRVEAWREGSMRDILSRLRDQKPEAENDD